jgi:hypothetical protein
MKKFKNLFAALTLTAVLAFGTNMASAGLLISDFAPTGGEEPCPETNSAVDISTGIIVLGLTGIIVLGVTDTDTAPCGIIVLG